MLMVKKKDGSKRIVIDYRKLNTNTLLDDYPIPRIDDTLDRLEGKALFTTLDATDGFWQILMKGLSKDYTGCTVQGVYYRWRVMPMGLKGSPLTFQRAMHHILAELVGKICLVYIDDVIVFGKDEEEHDRNLETVLQRLTKFNVKLKPKKCKVGFEKTGFLGFVVSKEGVSMDPEKTKAIRRITEPKTVKELRRFLESSRT